MYKPGIGIFGNRERERERELQQLILAFESPICKAPMMFLTVLNFETFIRSQVFESHFTGPLSNDKDELFGGNCFAQTH